MPRVSLSIVIPALNESGEIVHALTRLQLLRDQGVEVLLVDGGSEDDTVRLAKPLVDVVIDSDRGRGVQMNRGASAASGDYLLFLHVDSHLPPTFSADDLLGAAWGFFPVRLSGRAWLFRVIERAMCWRSALSGIATGDQGLFVRRDLFDAIGGYPAIPLMEDVAICRLLKGQCRPSRQRHPVTTSSRRWENRGILRTVLEMWRLRLAYFFGASPQYLAGSYYTNDIDRHR